MHSSSHTGGMVTTGSVQLLAFFWLWVAFCEAVIQDIDLATLSGPIGFKMIGSAPGDFTGISVSNAGDVNKDGIDDVIVGAHQTASGGKINCGVAYVIFGRSAALGAASYSDITLSSIKSNGNTFGFAVLGSAAGNYNGYSVKAAGDVNKDGIADVIVGAFAYGNAWGGRSYIIFGRDFAAGSSSYSNIDLATMDSVGTVQGFAVIGAYNYDYSGTSACSAGDVNGDAVDDVIVSSHLADVGSKINAGISYVIFGRSKAVDPSASYTNINLQSLNTAGSPIGFAILGAFSDDVTGNSVSGAGDVNGDGAADVIIGAFHASRMSGGTEYTGVAYVVFGRKYTTGTSHYQNIDLAGFVSAGSALGFAIIGSTLNDLCGHSVSAAGDVNKDGIADIIVGAPSANPNVGGVVRENGGAAYVVFGRTIATSGVTGYYVNIDTTALSTTGSALGFAIFGAVASDETGTSVRTAGDINGDGVDDVMVGSYADPVESGVSRPDAGVSYVVFGRIYTRGSVSYTNIDLSVFTIVSTFGYRIVGAAINDFSGVAVSGAGDVNKDGIVDMIVGAYKSNLGGSQSGAAYVVFGSMATPTSQPSSQPSCQPTSQPSRQPSAHPSAQPHSSPTVQPSCQPSAKPSSRPSRQPSCQPSAQPTSSPSVQPSTQPTARPTNQPSGQPSGEPSTRPTRIPTSQPTRQPSRQPSAQPSLKPTALPSSQPTRQPSAQPSHTPSSQPSSQPSRQPSRQPSGQPSLHPTAQPSVAPSSQPSVQPSNTPTTQPTTLPSGQPSDHPSAQPTSQPSPCPSSLPSAQPTRSPSSQPTGIPSMQPSGQPSCGPSSQPTAVPSAGPSAQPTSSPSTQPSGQPSGSPSCRPSSAPSAQPSSVPSTQPTTQPSTTPTIGPSSQPSSRPSSLPSSQPTGCPSARPSSAPSGHPSCQPSAGPTTQPTSCPSSQPSSQPSTRPSSVPSQQPRAAPSGQPTSTPSARPTLPPTGEWATVVSRSLQLTQVSGIGQHVWTCGRLVNGSSAVCVLSDSTSGAVLTQYPLTWDSVTSVTPGSSQDSVILCGRSSDGAVVTTEVASCTMEQHQLQCKVTSFHDTNFTAAVYVPYAKRFVHIGWYNVHTTVTIIDPASTAVQSFMYTASNMKALVLSQVQSPPYFVGGFVAGTTIRATASPVNYIVAGMVRTDGGIFSAMVLMPQSGDIVNSVDLVTAMALEVLGPDSFISGGLQLSAEDSVQAYVMRANALFMNVQHCVRYHSLVGGGRRVLSSNTVSRSLVRGMVLVNTVLFMIVDHTHKNVTSLTVLKTRIGDGAILKQVHVIAPNSTSLYCTDIALTGQILGIVCNVQLNAQAQSLLLTVDQDLSLAVLPAGFARSEDVVFQAETVPFKRTVLTISKTSTAIPTSSYEFHTADNGPTRRPSAAPSYLPSSQPSSAPSAQLSSSPTTAPTVSPQPTSQPSSASPTNTHKPSAVPTVLSTRQPSVEVTSRPSFRSTAGPSARPTVPPSAVPSPKPTAKPSVLSTIAPQPRPSMRPTAPPSRRPTAITTTPSLAPSTLVDVVEVNNNRRSRMPPYVVGASMGGGLGLLLVGYFVYQYYQNGKETKAREERKVEYYRQQAILVAQARAETAKFIQEEEDRLAAVRLERELRKADRRVAQERRGGGGGGGGGAYATGPALCIPAVHASALSVVSSSNVTMSSLHASEISSPKLSQESEYTPADTGSQPGSESWDGDEEALSEQYCELNSSDLSQFIDNIDDGSYF